MAEQKESVISTKLSKSTVNTVQFTVKTVSRKSTNQRFDDQFIVCAAYDKNEKIKNILDIIVEFVNTKFTPIQFEIFQICLENSFMDTDVWFDNKLYGTIINKSITEYQKSVITNYGFKVVIMPSYKYSSFRDINCDNMISKNTTDPLKCPIYYTMMKNKKYDENNFFHLKTYNHFRNAYEQKPQCEHNQQCEAFIRVENGGYNVSDLCHLILYRHPPRGQMIKLQQNVNSFIHHKQMYQNTKVYQDTEEDKATYKYNDKDGFILALIEETITNGYKYDLCLQCSKDDECKHDVHKTNSKTLLSIVDQKLKDKQHILRGSPLRRDHMLALVLYTGCDCNYDLCGQQRTGNYNKWKWFDHCLYWAIFKLSSAESGSFGVYSGLSNVQLNAKSVDIGYFVTYVSSSWRKEIAETFMKGKGMVIHFNESFKNSYRVKCCDVSWISKFGDECEILFARNSTGYGFNKGFKCNVIDENNGVQTVSLSKTPRKN